jgi:hypothetical protein
MSMPVPRASVRDVSSRVLLALCVVATTLGTASAAEVPVRFVEGVVHGFLVLRTVDGAQVAQGDLFQVARAGEVEGHTVLHFDDGSIFDETVFFTEQRVFTLQRYRLVQRGPAFPVDTEIALDRAASTYRVKTTDHTGGRPTVINGKLDLPPDVYNGMVFAVTKNLLKGATETVHMVAFTPEPRIIQLEIAPTNEQKVLVGKLSKTAIHYVLRPKLGVWLTFFATIVGSVPPDEHVWVATDEVPAFVRFEGPLYMKGPIWRIELTSPRWPG